MNRISPEKLSVLSELVVRKPQEALTLLRQYEREFEGDLNLALNRGGVLVDIGANLNRTDLVQEGIKVIEGILDQLDDERPGLFYNLANGHSELANLERRQKGEEYRFDPDVTPLVRAKYCYRQSLAGKEQLSIDLRAQLWVNYGNCLSSLGRAVEAISAYDRALQLSPEHPMAKGNLGIELHHFARIAEHAVFLLDARGMLTEALSHERLENFSTRARHHFQSTRHRIDQMLSKLGIDPNAQIGYETPVFSSEYQRAYVEFCARYQLFLNFCLRCRRCDRYAKDSLTFSLITDIDDKTSFIRLTRVTNEIKERFAFARLLLFQSLHPILDTVPFDETTNYVDNLDYAVYGVRVASLKLAFEGAYNILDKIAHFVNDYLELGIKPGPKLTFTTNGWVWHEKGGAVLRHEMLELSNWYLFGLYDLARDLDIDQRRPERDGHWGRLRRIRNALTHEYLIPHVEGMHWAIEADGPASHLYHRDLVEQTISLLQLVRAAIIYLIAFIDQEERKKRQASNDFIAPTSVNRYDAALFTPALDSWD